jgi:DNA-binding HxlR family transcriptional regulator
MPDYGQYCPVARGAEIFAERWTPILLRNLLLGCTTFNDLAAGCPGMSRSLLSRRLRELERGSLYVLTPAGHAFEPVIMELGLWAEQWTDVRPQDADPAVVVWSWGRLYLNADEFPARRVVVRFEFQRGGRRQLLWLLVENGSAELCAFDPSFGDDLVVQVNNTVDLARWHLGQLEWSRLVKSRAVVVTGPTNLRRALPHTNTRPQVGQQMQALIASRSASAADMATN